MHGLYLGENKVRDKWSFKVEKGRTIMGETKRKGWYRASHVSRLLVSMLSWLCALLLQSLFLLKPATV